MRHHFETQFAPRGIDVENGVVMGATICTAGVEAKGHGLQTDGMLLRQLLASAQKKQTIPVGLDHKSGVKGTAGAATNFRISGNKLLADIEFFKTHADFPLVMDQLSTLGGTMGISASFTGAADGVKARCKELLSCDVVNFPAANPSGLFSARYENEGDDDMNENDDENEPLTAEDLAEMIEGMLAHIEDLEQENEHLWQVVEQLQGDADDDEEGDDEPVLEEHGARGGPNGLASVYVTSNDFAARVEQFQLEGLSQKSAHIKALQEFARSRSRNQALNL